MAKTSLTSRIESLQTDVCQQRHLIHVQMAQIEKQQTVLDVQFHRIANMQAELDLVKATVRLAAPTFAALLIGRSPSVSAAATSADVPSFGDDPHAIADRLPPFRPARVRSALRA